MNHPSDQACNFHLSETSVRMLSLTDAVVAEWKFQVVQLIGEAGSLPEPILVDTLPTFYANIAEAITDSYPREHGSAGSTVPMEHGGERARLTEFDAETLVHEYQIFRSAITSVLDREGLKLSTAELRIVNTSIDEAIREAVSSYGLTHAVMLEHTVASFTHDLRSPLASLRMTAEIIQLKADSDEIRTLAARLLDINKFMSDIVGNLLSTVCVGGAEELNLEFKGMQIGEILQAASARYQSDFEVDLHVHGEDVSGFWCAEALRLAVDHLVGNAIKFGYPDMPIAICTSTAYGRMTLSVHSDGQSVSPQEVESILQVLKTGVLTSDLEKSGWGAWLPYVKSVAEAHGGSIAVNCADGRGITFTIDIPVDSRPFKKVIAR